MAPVESLDAMLTQQVADIHRAASSVAAGGGPAWDVLLRHYGVTPLDARERALIVSHMRLPRGAVPAEVRLVLQGLQGWAQRELDRWLADPGFVTGESVERLGQRIAQLAQHETEAYERALGLTPLPPRAQPSPAPAAPSLGSIFANARQTPRARPAAHAQAVVLTCLCCGGPQEQPLDFLCRYCGRPIAGPIEPPG